MFLEEKKQFSIKKRIVFVIDFKLELLKLRDINSVLRSFLCASPQKA